MYYIFYTLVWCFFFSPCSLLYCFYFHYVIDIFSYSVVKHISQPGLYAVNSNMFSLLEKNEGNRLPLFFQSRLKRKIKVKLIISYCLLNSFITPVHCKWTKLCNFLPFTFTIIKICIRNHDISLKQKSPNHYSNFFSRTVPYEQHFHVLYFLYHVFINKCFINNLTQFNSYILHQMIWQAYLLHQAMNKWSY